jgi:hypothetical protein
MSRLILPLLLSTVAFGAAWWAGSTLPAPSPTAGSAGEVPAARTIQDSVPDLPGPALSGFARRSAQLQRTENPDYRSIASLITEPGLDYSEISRLAGIWADQDPAGFWAWLEQGGKEKLPGKDLSYQVFRGWFRLDCDAAMAAFRAGDAERKRSAAMGLLTHLTGDDAALRKRLVPFLDEIVADGGQAILHTKKPAETVAQLMSMPPGAGRDTLLESVGSSWLESDWKSATAWAATLTEPVKSKILTNLAKATFFAGMSGFSMPGQPASNAEAACFEWARQWLATEAPPEAKRKLGNAFVSKLASTDPAAALDWAQDNMSARPLTQAMGAVLKAQQKKDPAAARALVEGLPPGGMKSRVAFAIAGPASPETVAWLLQQVDLDPKYQWSQLSSDWAFQDPAAYRAYLESPSAKKLPRGLTQGGMSNLVKKDGSGTMEWAVRTQSPATATYALQSWTRENAAAAVDWALKRPPGAARAAALVTVQESLGNSSITSSERSALQSRLEKP